MGDCTEECIDPKKIPFGFNVCGCYEGVCRNEVIRFSEYIRCEKVKYKKKSKNNKDSKDILNRVIRVEGDAGSVPIYP